jgi:hypothetical protein
MIAGPLVGFALGYGARAFGLSPLNASLIGLGTSIGYTGAIRLGLGSALRSGGMWLAADLYAGAAAAASASATVAVVGGTAIAVGAGYAAATIISGETGREQLTDFLTGGVSPSEYMAALDAAHNRRRSLAVEGNVAGIPAGTSEWEMMHPESRYNPFTGKENPLFTGSML